MKKEKKENIWWFEMANYPNIFICLGNKGLKIETVSAWAHKNEKCLTLDVRSCWHRIKLKINLLECMRRHNQLPYLRRPSILGLTKRK